MEKKELSLNFGRKYRVGNYTVIKKVRSLSKSEQRRLRDSAGIPKEVQKHLSRGGLPYITVETSFGGWSVSFVCGMTVYALIDRELSEALMDKEEPREDYKGATVADFAHLFNMWYTDTTIPGDAEYQKDKARAIEAFMNRHKAAKETPESKAEDDKILEEVKADEEAKANIIDMAKEIAKDKKGESRK